MMPVLVFGKISMVAGCIYGYIGCLYKMAVFCVRILTSISWSFYFCPQADFQNGGRQNVIYVSLFLSLISTSYWTNMSKVLTRHTVFH